MSFQKIDVPGDGDCLYHAVVLAFEQKYAIKLVRRANALRRALAAYMKSKGIADSAGRRAMRRLLTGGYGEEYEVRMLTELLSTVLKSRVCIAVYNARGDIPNHYRWQTFTPDFAQVYTPKNKQRRCGYTIHLLNSGHGATEHFQVLHIPNHRSTKWG